MFIVFSMLSSFVFLYEYMLFFLPGASALPPSIQQFYGGITLANGSLGNNILVEAKADSSVIASSYSKDGKYGYDPLFVVENLEDGSIIEFYLNSVKVGEAAFENFGFTNLNLQMKDVCGDGFCGGDETCTNCAEDCGTCSVNPPVVDDGGGSSGGGGGGGGGASSGGYVNNQQASSENINQENNLNDSNEIPEDVTGKQSPITGNVVIEDFLSNKLFIPVVLGLIILLVLIILEILSVRRHHLEEVRKGKLSIS